MTIVSDIEARFHGNLERVAGLVRVFEVGGGNSDILRAAVVLLHAALEELVRSTVRVLLPRSPRPFEKMVFAWFGSEKRGPDKISLQQLADFRGKTVEEILDRAFEYHLDHSSYNYPAEVIGALRELRVTLPPEEELRPILRELSPMMARRHRIAHCADAERGGQGLQQLEAQEVMTWLEAVRALGVLVVPELRRLS